MRIKVVACEVVARELYWCAARSPNAVNITLLPQGLHNSPEMLRERLQAEIEAVDPDRYGAIVVGFGLCSNSLDGIRAGRLPLIVPRAHDCITLLLGSKERYAEMFSEAAGTYWFSAGWIDSRKPGEDLPEQSPDGGAGPGCAKRYEELVAKYGEDNAKYLVEVMDGWEGRYTRGALVEFPFDGSLGLREKVREICESKDWEMMPVRGDLSLLEAGLDGPWDDERFLTVWPGQTIRACHDAAILRAEAVGPDRQETPA